MGTFTGLRKMGRVQQQPKGRGWVGEVQVLTAGHDLPLQLVAGQVKHPKDCIVQEDEEQHEEEVLDKAEDRQGINDLLPVRQEDGAWVGDGKVRRMRPNSPTPQPLVLRSPS